MKICLTLALVVVAQVAMADEPTRVTRLPAVAKSQAVVKDVALQQGGVLKGQLLTTAGAPQANTQVVLVQNGKLLAATKTNTNGQFAVVGLKPGVYQIETPHSGGVYRAWAPRTAPPAAKNAALLIGDGDVVRGQDFVDEYGPALRGAAAGGLLVGGTYWALDRNPEGS